MLVNNPYYVYINSRERINQDDPDENFTYSINFPDGQTFTHVVCLNVLIPKSFYLIQTGVNEGIFQLDENGVTVTVTLPVGNYLLSAFKKVVGAAMTAVSPNSLTYTLTYSTSTTTADIGKWVYTQNDGSIQSTIITNGHLFEPLGFLSNSTNAFTGTSLTSTAVIKLQSEDRLLLHSNLVNNGRDDILVSINSISNVNYSSIAWECPAPEYYVHELNSNKNNTYSFSLTDENNEIIQLNNLNLNCTLLFFKADNIYQDIRNMMKILISKLRN